jgi:hypothetical protein
MWMTLRPVIRARTAIACTWATRTSLGSRSSPTKDRLSFITVLWNASPCPDYRVDAMAVEYLRTRGASQWLIDRFTYQSVTSLPDDAAWEAYLKARLIVEAEEVRRVTEAARLASLVAQGWLEQTVILSDGAGQFAILCHALGWIHAERALRRLVPPGPVQRQAHRSGCSMRSGSTTGH